MGLGLRILRTFWHVPLTAKSQQNWVSDQSCAAAGGSSGGDDGLLDSFVQSEINQQIEKGEKENRDLKKQVEALTNEKLKLLDQVDTLSAGNERFVEMKEQQDNQMELLKSHQVLEDRRRHWLRS